MALHRSIATGLAVTVLFGAGVHLSAQARFEVPNTTGTSWYKGNTHAHTVESDGDSSPDYVAQWYKAHGYNFLVISDHNVFTDISQLSHLTDSDFILIPGEELSTGYEGLPVHVNGLNLPGLVYPRTGSMIVATIQNNVDAIREVEGVQHVNHLNDPNVTSPNLIIAHSFTAWAAGAPPGTQSGAGVALRRRAAIVASSAHPPGPAARRKRDRRSVPRGTRTRRPGGRWEQQR